MKCATCGNEIDREFIISVKTEHELQGSENMSRTELRSTLLTVCEDCYTDHCEA